MQEEDPVASLHTLWEGQRPRKRKLYLRTTRRIREMCPEDATRFGIRWFETVLHCIPHPAGFVMVMRALQERWPRDSRSIDELQNHWRMLRHNLATMATLSDNKHERRCLLRCETVLIGFILRIVPW
jgi:hypothetical protein